MYKVCYPGKQSELSPFQLEPEIRSQFPEELQSMSIPVTLDVPGVQKHAKRLSYEPTVTIYLIRSMILISKLIRGCFKVRYLKKDCYQ